MTWAIEATNLEKHYGELKALAGVSFQVPRETVFCILGSNGAGKTTLLKILTTVSHATAGAARIEGFDVRSQVQDVRQRIGVVAQDNHFDRYLDVWHNLTLHAEMHGMSKSVYEPRIRELLERVGLYDRRDALADDLSGGMQRRIALIRALIHEPKVLFLDEPTTGLDPQARLEIWETIEQFKRTATVVLTTHYMDEADRLSDRLLMISRGQIVAEGTADELKGALSPSDKYTLTFKAPEAAAQLTALQTALGTSHPEIMLTQADDFRLTCQVPAPGAINTVLQALDASALRQFGLAEADLEDVFMSLARNPGKNAPISGTAPKETA